MSVSYRVDLIAGDAGDLSWEVTSDDPKPSTLPSGGLILDGLSWTRRLPERDVWPCQPDPSTLTLTVDAPTAAELSAHLVVGAPVGMLVRRWRTIEELWSLQDFWSGYIADVSIEGHRVRDGDIYARAVVSCIDWTAALGEVDLPDEVWPLEAAQNRIQRIFGAVQDRAPELPHLWEYTGSTWDPLHDGPPDGQHVGLVETDVDGRNALEVLRETLAAWTLFATTGDYAGETARYLCQPFNPDWLGVVIDTEPLSALLRPDRWRITPRLASDPHTPLATFGDNGDGWGVVMDDYTGPEDGLIPAAMVALSARWTQRVGAVPTTAVVKVPFTGSPKGFYVWRHELGRPRPRIRVKVEAPIEFGVASDAYFVSGIAATVRLAMLLIPDNITPSSYWAADDFLWYHDQTPDAARWLPEMGALVVVTDVPADVHPTGGTRVVGLLDHYTVTMRKGAPELLFGLRPLLRDPAGPDVLTYDDLDPEPTYDDLDPAMTYNDLRLLRAP